MFGQAPLGTKISRKGVNGIDGVWAHNFTLAKPGSISKHISAGDLRVLADG